MGLTLTKVLASSCFLFNQIIFREFILSNTTRLRTYDAMDSNKRIELIHDVQSKLWVDKVNHARLTGQFPKWISIFHPDRLSCELEGGFTHGSYNLGQKLTFSDGTSWLLRLPIIGNICDQYADEKVAMEVKMLVLIREKTTIPVPHVKAWGI